MLLDNTELGIILAHTSRRILLNYKAPERPKAMSIILRKLTTYLRKQDNLNSKRFIKCTKLEREAWANTIKDYDPKAQLLVIDLFAKIYMKYSMPFNKKIMISDKLIEKLGAIYIMCNENVTVELEQSDDKLLNKYILMLEPFTGVGIVKSAFRLSREKV